MGDGTLCTALVAVGIAGVVIDVVTHLTDSTADVAIGVASVVVLVGIGGEEEGKHNGSAFDVGKQTLYRQLYYRITEGTPMTVTPEMATDVIGVIAAAYEENRLDVKF